ncbi:zinc finger BED domain-containing protein [Anoplopoma fimbria]|uniref:zinc finger BED domain-containing protein n=1 Tax=Anoplopoma fimbria TaxID=229290 RepID=UPI0023ED7160|nr:zinc finger BED domain-containing protein [Anoplopoma fimbria]
MTTRRERATGTATQASFGAFLKPSLPIQGHKEDMDTDSEHFCFVEVALEDGDSDTFTVVNEFGINSAINGIPEGAQGLPVEQITHEGASDEPPVKRRRNKRSLIWRHYEELDSLAAARCRICMKLQSFEGGSTSNLHRHMSKRHPEVFSQLAADRHHPPPAHSSQSSDTKVEVVLEDGDPFNSTMNGILECAQGRPAEQMRHEEASDDHPVKRRRSKRSLIWRHYEQLDSLAAARCCICLKKLQYFEGGSTSNLHRHMSKRHPEVFSQLLADGQHPPPPPHSSQSSDVNGDTLMQPENVGATEKQRQFSGLLKVSKASEGEKRVFRRERELIEALRRAQREEARALEHQRELLEKLRAVNARETAAEREQIESLRTAQLEEAKYLIRQREEVQKEKTELLKKRKELQQEREELVLFSSRQQAS